MLKNKDNRNRPSDKIKPLTAIFLLDRYDSSVSDREISIRKPPPSEVFRLLLSHAYCFSLDETAVKERTVKAYLDLSEAVPVYELSYPSGYEHLPAVIATIESAIFPSQ